MLVETGAWPDDADRFLASLERHRGHHSVEVVPANQGELGFGATQNEALAKATGDVVILVDTSLELTGDLLSDLVGALDDPSVGLTGPSGLTTAALCDYEERTAGDVAAIQGYCLGAGVNIAGVCDPSGLVFGLMPVSRAICCCEIPPTRTRCRTVNH